LRNAKLSQVNLTGANLQGTDLRNAVLKNVDLSRDDWHKIWSRLKDGFKERKKALCMPFYPRRKANLQATDLRGADLEATENLIDADLDNAVYDGRTKWPLDFDPQATGATLEE
jgi:uncharacterized protein YjbI with pentapeptide repeats